MRLAIVGVLVFIAAYVVSIVVYVVGGMGQPRQIGETRSVGGSTVTVDFEEIQSDNSVLRADITVAPEPALLDPKTYTLKDDLTVAVTSLVAPANAPGRRAHCPTFSPYRGLLAVTSRIGPSIATIPGRSASNFQLARHRYRSDRR